MISALGGGGRQIWATQRVRDSLGNGGPYLKSKWNDRIGKVGEKKRFRDRKTSYFKSLQKEDAPSPRLWGWVKATRQEQWRMRGREVIHTVSCESERWWFQASHLVQRENTFRVSGRRKHGLAPPTPKWRHYHPPVYCNTHEKNKIMTMSVLRKYDMHNPISGGRLTLVHYPNKTDYRIHCPNK